MIESRQRTKLTYESNQSAKLQLAMDGLKWRICIIKPSLKFTTALGIVDPLALYQTPVVVNNSDDASLDDVSFYIQEDSIYQRADDHSSALNGGYNLNDEPDASSGLDMLRIVKYTIDFLRPYLRENGKLQPTATLQQHYANFQHKKDKQSNIVSVKPWFSYTEIKDECKGLWWTAEVSVPEEVAEDWGLDRRDGSISSGHLPLLLDEWKMVNAAFDGQDLLSALFGKFKVQSDGEIDTLLFKNKAAAQKSATLNLLFCLEPPKRIKVEADPTINESTKSVKIEAHPTINESSRTEPVHPKQYPLWVNRLFALGFGSKAAPRYTLNSIKHHAALRDPKGPILSAKNPCVVTCVITYTENSSGEPMSIKSGDHFTKDHAFEDMIRCVETSFNPTNVPCQSAVVEEQERDYIMENYDPIVFYEKALPLWSTAPVESTAFLYELKFTTNNTSSTTSSEISSNRTIPFCNSYGLEESESTRIGLITGSDIFDVLIDGEQELSTDFTIPSSKVDHHVSVTIFNRTAIDVTELKNQMLDTTELDPVSLMKCFNAILFQNGGRTYGLGPAKSQEEILSQMCNNRSDFDRTYMLLPLKPSKSISDKGLLIDWKVVTYVVNDTWSPVLDIRDGNKPHLVRKSTLYNRFIKQPVGFRGNLFVVDMDPSSNLTAESLLQSLLPEDVMAIVSHETKAQFYDRCGIELENATYASYHTCCWANKKRPEDLESSVLKYPHQSLIKARRVLSHLDSDFIISLAKGNNSSANNNCKQPPIASLVIEAGYLIPELAVFLPMPRDLLYLAHHSCHFMTALERAHDLKTASARLLNMQHEAGNILQEHTTSSPTNLTKLIDDATKLDSKEPLIRENERLESLGDAVLMFLITMNVFSTCSQRYDYVLDFFKEEITTLGKNEVLSAGATLMGLSRLSHDKNNSISSWRTACMPNPTSRPNKKWSVKNIADTMESILGAAFLTDPTGAMVVGILNEIAPCFNAAKGQQDINPSHWFNAVSTCMQGGYQFERDRPWMSELNRLKMILDDSSVLTTLEAGADSLLGIFLELSDSDKLIANIKAKDFSLLLIHAALFDDSLDEMYGDEGPDANGLEQIAILRDKLFHVGNSTLLLSMLNEIYQSSAATSGDLHFSKISVLSDDALCYIFIKNGLQNCLFDEESDACEMFAYHMNVADSLGKAFYEEKNMAVPRYCGLAAGRLFGEKGAVSRDITEEIVFTFKTIVGAFCLSIGLKDTWILVRPLFSELLLLSHDEMRETFAHVSDVAAKNKKGSH